MKEVVTEKIEKIIMYEAPDGTQFKNKEECKKYEDSLLGILKAKYAKIKLKTYSEYDLFGVGQEDGYIDIVKLTSKEDIDTILHLCQYYGYKSEESINRNLKFLEKAYKENDYVLMWSGDDYSDYYNVLGVFGDILNNIKDKIINCTEKQNNKNENSIDQNLLLKCKNTPIHIYNLYKKDSEYNYNNYFVSDSLNISNNCINCPNYKNIKEGKMLVCNCILGTNIVY